MVPCAYAYHYILLTVMALKPNQLQDTTITSQVMQSFSKYTKLSMICSDHMTWKIIMKI
jgi:hypothetical protein